MLLPLYDDNPNQQRPVVTVTLILINALVFLYEISLPDQALVELVYAAGFLPSRLIGGEVPQGVELLPLPFTLVTHMFMHGGWMHLIGNMWFLWIFGDNVEDRLGHLRFLGIYLAWGWVAAAAQFIFGGDPSVPMVGASGAIAGVLGAYAVLYPGAKVHVLLFIFILITRIRVPALLMLSLWFGYQFMSLSEAGVAWWAHIGGFVAGVFVAIVLKISRPT
ncbi:MAG: rhomboid family intramembrane serine protease [Myxococcota bacterium]